MQSTTNVSVIGTGYLGATHAAGMADLGHNVVGMDTDAERIELLAAGKLPFYEPGLQELLQRGLASGRLRFTTSFGEVAARADVHFICVGTPQQDGSNAADLRYVVSAVASLAASLTRKALIVGKSTVPAGTTARLAGLARGYLRPDVDVEFAWNPEFLREGYAVADTLHPDRLVFGVQGASAERTLRTVYQRMVDDGCPVVVTDYATAELVKVAANSFLATKISFINAMAEVCEATGADVSTLSEALGHDERIGRRFLHPGLGFGGGCLPKDIRAFIARAEELGITQAIGFLREVDAINMRRRSRMIEIVSDSLGGKVDGSRIAVWGAAFKPNSDDVRDSPALDVASTLQARGAGVAVYDPQAVESARRRFPELEYCGSALDCAASADVILHLTEWSEFRAFDPRRLDGVVSHRRVVDGRNALDPVRWRSAGWEYRALGRP